MSANAPAESIYSPPDGFVENLLHHSGTPRSQYPEPPQSEIAQTIERPQAPAPATPHTPSEPKTRLRKACDSCSARKVKCDESGPPCRSCVALDIPCTFERPSRRRGPPNRHAEAVKRQRLEQDGTWAASALSPTEDAAHSLASLSGTQALSAESICDIHTLRILIDDYFTYIHPLTPLPHEPTFRAAFERREDRTNRSFLALLTAMIEALVASFPRRPRQLFTSESNRRLFPNAGALIDRCHQVFTEARGLGYLDRKLSLYDAFSSYLVGLTAAYLFDSNRAGLYLGECVSIVRRLALHRTTTDPSMQSPIYGGAAGELDLIQQELSRRLFWLCYVACHSWRQLGDGDGDLLMPLSARKDPPPFPLEIDDAYIYQDRILPQPPATLSIIAGFNLNVRVFRSSSSLTAVESALGIEGVDWEKQRQLIGQALYSCKSVTEDAPDELRIKSLTSRENRYASPVPQIGQYGRQQEMWPEQDDQQSTVLDFSRRKAQYEIQKANIYASQLGTRSFLVERYWDLFELQTAAANGLGQSLSPTTSTANAVVDSKLQNAFGSPAATIHSRPNSGHGIDVTEHAMALERENIVRDLAIFLQNMEQMYMEPNGLSLCHKIRQVASTLVHVPRSRASMPTLDRDSVFAYLTTFLDIMMKLERLGNGWIRGDVTSPYKFSFEEGVDVGDGLDVAGGLAGLGDGLAAGARVLSDAEIEERELAEWASLKECQMKFLRENGVETGTGTGTGLGAGSAMPL